MYNSGDNRLGPAGYGIVGYEMVLEMIRTIAPADRVDAQSASRLSPVRNFSRKLRGLSQRQPSNSTTATDPACIQSADA